MSNLKHKLSQLLANCKKNQLYIIIGLAVAANGGCLWIDKLLAKHGYFFWPPQWAWLMNDDGFDAIAVIAGVGLIIYALMNAHNNAVSGILLGTCAAFMTLVALVELGHALFAGQFRMLNTIIGDVFIVLIILYTARNRNTKR
ncbi:MAG: hypothetical protein LKE17_00050 [Lactobacillus sp.]|jgi:hypothetical protein|nr:hypothetical protein [Lactobacillus sp.]